MIIHSKYVMRYMNYTTSFPCDILVPWIYGCWTCIQATIKKIRTQFRTTLPIERLMILITIHGYFTDKPIKKKMPGVGWGRVGGGVGWGGWGWGLGVVGGGWWYPIISGWRVDHFMMCIHRLNLEYHTQSSWALEGPVYLSYMHISLTNHRTSYWSLTVINKVRHAWTTFHLRHTF